jgi:hypothetical protein
MTLPDLMSTIDALDIKLSLRLVVDAPPGVISEELRDELAAHKPALLYRLGQNALHNRDRQQEQGKPKPIQLTTTATSLNPPTPVKAPGIASNGPDGLDWPEAQRFLANALNAVPDIPASPVECELAAQLILDGERQRGATPAQVLADYWAEWSLPGNPSSVPQTVDNPGEPQEKARIEPIRSTPFPQTPLETSPLRDRIRCHDRIQTTLFPEEIEQPAKPGWTFHPGRER